MIPIVCSIDELWCGWDNKLESNRSGKDCACCQERMETDLFKKADFEPNGDDLAKFGRRSKIFAAGTEIGEAEVAGASQFEARRNERGIQIHDGAKLDFEAQLDHAG